MCIGKMRHVHDTTCMIHTTTQASRELLVGRVGVLCPAPTLLMVLLATFLPLAAAARFPAAAASSSTHSSSQSHSSSEHYNFHNVGKSHKSGKSHASAPSSSAKSAWQKSSSHASASGSSSKASSSSGSGGYRGGSQNTEGLKNIKHIVLFMQENRAFDHYFGTMRGVRGFQDPNVHISKNTNKTVWHQPVDGITPVDGVLLGPLPPPHVKEMLPFYLAWQGREWANRTQCMLAGTNEWQTNHDAWNHGEIDNWARKNTPFSLGYYKREDVPVHFALADNFVVGDSYYESVISSTYPNRVTWWTGTINAPGSETGGDGHNLGGPTYDNHFLPGCSRTAEGGPMSCTPMRWKTVPEYMQEAGISWQVYQDLDNLGDDPLILFEQYGDSSKKKGELAHRGLASVGLKKFFHDAREGTLPEVSYLVAPSDLAEHPPFPPQDGGWLQRKVAHAVMNGKGWNNTVLMISYDETGGFADHVMSPHAPKDEPGEWVTDPYDKKKGKSPTGPGFRLPFYILSPWTRNGGVFTEHSAHESQILFLEEWAKATGRPFKSKEMNRWRREQMSNLVNAFDFSKHDTSAPDLPVTPQASRDPLTGTYNGVVTCLARYAGFVLPKIPYGKQSLKELQSVEKGYKPMRGTPTEGRHVAFESGKYALTKRGNKVVAGKKTPQHNNRDQLFVLHAVGSAPRDLRFRISTSTFQDGKTGQYITQQLGLSDNKEDGAIFTISYENGSYSLENTQTHQHLSLKNGKAALQNDEASFSFFSVTV